jgi:hypothetical protein
VIDTQRPVREASTFPMENNRVIMNIAQALGGKRNAVML